jgi:hypothetical protein
MKYLGEVEVGNAFYVEAEFIATRIAPTAESSAVTFTIRTPAGVETPTSSPNAAIAGPTATVLDDGRHKTVWSLAISPLTAPGRYTVRARSTAGLLASQDSCFEVLAYVPLASA